VEERGKTLRSGKRGGGMGGFGGMGRRLG